MSASPTHYEPICWKKVSLSPTTWGALTALFFMVSGIPDNDRARAFLETQNYTSIQTNGLAFAFSAECSTLLKTSFDAVSGENRVSGVVCSNLLDGANRIHFDRFERMDTPRPNGTY